MLGTTPDPDIQVANRKDRHKNKIRQFQFDRLGERPSTVTEGDVDVDDDEAKVPNR